MSVKQVVALGLFVGLVGAGGQLQLMRLGLIASGPLRGTLSIFLAVMIGLITGKWAPQDGVKAAALAGVIAGTMFSLIGLGALLMDPSVIGQTPWGSLEAFFRFVSSLIMSTVIASWLIAGICVLVALPVSLSQAESSQ